jgi:DNA-binding beta-propeller fold protein YncE
VIEGFGSLWVINTGTAGATTNGAVQRIDPRTNRVISTFPLGRQPRFAAAGEGGIWVLNQGDSTVSRVDAATGREVARIPLGGGSALGDIAAGAGHVWVRTEQLLLAVIDPKTNRVVARYGPPAGSGAVRVAGESVWLTAHDVDSLWRIRARP